MTPLGLALAESDIAAVEMLLSVGGGGSFITHPFSLTTISVLFLSFQPFLLMYLGRSWPRRPFRPRLHSTTALDRFRGQEGWNRGGQWYHFCNHRLLRTLSHFSSCSWQQALTCMRSRRFRSTSAHTPIPVRFVGINFFVSTYRVIVPLYSLSSQCSQ